MMTLEALIIPICMFVLIEYQIIRLICDLNKIEKRLDRILYKDNGNIAREAMK